MSSFWRCSEGYSIAHMSLWTRAMRKNYWHFIFSFISFSRQCHSKNSRSEPNFRNHSKSFSNVHECNKLKKKQFRIQTKDQKKAFIFPEFNFKKCEMILYTHISKVLIFLSCLLLTIIASISFIVLVIIRVQNFIFSSAVELMTLRYIHNPELRWESSHGSYLHKMHLQIDLRNDNCNSSWYGFCIEV